MGKPYTPKPLNPKPKTQVCGRGVPEVSRQSGTQSEGPEFWRIPEEINPQNGWWTRSSNIQDIINLPVVMVDNPYHI